MATPKYNTYVGMRYVPIFDGEWDSTKTYEPLTIVSYQGNSYTSRTFIPIGMNINNTEYWALTGNYNAQVEYYRQETQRVAEDMLSYVKSFNTVADMIDDANLGSGEVCHTNGYTEVSDGGGCYYIINETEVSGKNNIELDNGRYATMVEFDYVTPEMYGAVGDGVTDDTSAIQAAIDSDVPVVKFGAKTYKTTAQLNVNKPKELVGVNSWYVETPNIETVGTYINSTANICFDISSESVSFKNITAHGVETTFNIYNVSTSDPTQRTSTFNVEMINCCSLAATGGAEQTYGFKVFRTVAVKFDHCVAVGGNTGFWCAESTGTSTIFSNCWCRNLTYAFSLTSCKYVVFENCFSDINTRLFLLNLCECITFIGCATEQTARAISADNCSHLDFINIFVYNSSATGDNPSVARFTGCSYISINGSYLKGASDSTTYDITFDNTSRLDTCNISDNWRTNAEPYKQLHTYIRTPSISSSNQYELDLTSVFDMTKVDVVGATVAATGQSTTNDYTTNWMIRNNKLQVYFSVTQNYTATIIIFYRNKPAN